MKKTLYLLLITGIFINNAFASGVGYINYDKVIANYQYAKNTLTEIENKGKEIQAFLESKEAEFDKLESAVQRKKFETTVRAQLEAKEKAFNTFRERREEEVYKRIHAVTEKIRMEKELDAVLDARSVFSGGIDITDDLIKKLNNDSAVNSGK